MIDRELLELAAKAAGMTDAKWSRLDDGICFNFRRDEDGENYSFWNPLTDDGDALRLAVKLSITVDIGHNLYTEASAYPDKDTTRDMIQVEQRFDGDPYAATRRAIVRAAAEIWKQKRELAIP